MNRPQAATGWQSYASAPKSGTVICALADVAEHGVASLSIKDFPILLVRRGQWLRAYVNACPHQYLPLDQRGAQVLSADGNTLRCTNHHAGFCVETGVGTEGFGLGECLDAIPIAVDTQVRIIIATSAETQGTP